MNNGNNDEWIKFQKGFLDRFNGLTEMDNTQPTEITRKLLFCIIAGDEYYYSRAEEIYDFENRKIRPESLENPRIHYQILSEYL